MLSFNNIKKPIILIIVTLLISSCEFINKSKKSDAVEFPHPEISTCQIAGEVAPLYNGLVIKEHLEKRQSQLSGTAKNFQDKTNIGNYLAEFHGLSGTCNYPIEILELTCDGQVKVIYENKESILTSLSEFLNDKNYVLARETKICGNWTFADDITLFVRSESLIFDKSSITLLEKSFVSFSSQFSSGVENLDFVEIHPKSVFEVHIKE